MTVTSGGAGSGLLAAAVAGDERAFQRLVEPHRRQLLAHCYRMLGSLDDADDAVQETLLKAWRGLAGFAGRSSLRGWLYRIATNVCLDALDHRARRILPTAVAAPADPHRPPDPDDPDLPWHTPMPCSTSRTPTRSPTQLQPRRAGRTSSWRSSVQYLPPRQRAVLLLREVLGFTAAETAAMLATSATSVHSALQRARGTLRERLTESPEPVAQQADLVARYVRAWHAKDVPALLALPREDAYMAMPPTPSWYSGRDSIGIYLCQLFASPWGTDLRLMPTAANRQPAFGVYAPAERGDGHQPFALKLLTIHKGLITAITGFVHLGLFNRFELPGWLPVGQLDVGSAEDLSVDLDLDPVGSGVDAAHRDLPERVPSGDHLR